MIDTTLAFLFPGQGSQAVGMLADIAQQQSIVHDTFAEASEALGYDMWDLVQNAEQEQLNLTEKTQPIMLVSSVALWRVWQSSSEVRPAFLAGHSLGEFSALVCAGSLNFVDAVTLVRDRGRFMQTAVPLGEGAMAAVLGLSDDVIAEICDKASSSSVVEAVNYNSPGQVVIAGLVAGVEVAIALCKDAGAKRVMPLPVSAPFHTSLMRPAGEKLADKVAQLALAAPSIPVVHNVHGQTESEPEKIKELLIQQIYSPVKWVDCIQTMVNSGIEKTIECGPGKVLSGLSRRIHKPLSVFNIQDSAGLEKALAEV